MASTWQTINLPPPVVSGKDFKGDVMLLLTDGSVLIHNSNGKEWLRFNPDPKENYSGKSWSFQYTESDMTHAKEDFASGVLMDGRVFAIGGEYLNGSSVPVDSPLGEIFDPQTNSWSPIDKPSPKFDFVCGDCNGSILKDGRVLLGGVASPATNRMAIWDPKVNKWSEAGY
jgi:hypothetical protein